MNVPRFSDTFKGCCESDAHIASAVTRAYVATRHLHSNPSEALQGTATRHRLSGTEQLFRK
jgi:hypothetical protein